MASDIESTASSSQPSHMMQYSNLHPGH